MAAQGVDSASYGHRFWYITHFKLEVAWPAKLFLKNAIHTPEDMVFVRLILS